MRTQLLSAAFLLFTAATFSSCKKDTAVPLQILLTDKPATYEEVNVEIVGVRIKTSKDTSGWQSIQVNPGVYDLLTLRNGVTTQLATGQVPNGTLTEVRLLLGTKNSVKVDGVVYPLQTPSAEHAGLKIKIGKALSETMNTFVLDFDASLSVQQTGANYKLHPVIRLK